MDPHFNFLLTWDSIRYPKCPPSMHGVTLAKIFKHFMVLTMGTKTTLSSKWTSQREVRKQGQTAREEGPGPEEGLWRAGAVPETGASVYELVVGWGEDAVCEFQHKWSTLDGLGTG